MALLLSYNFRNLFVRRTSTIMSVIGIALVVTVLVTMLALAQGFRSAVVTTGSDTNLLVMRDGATSELSSAIDRDTFQLIRTLPGIARDDRGDPLITGEALLVINHPKAKGGEPTNVTLRGISDISLKIRDNISIIEGRPIRPGTNELLAGRAISNRVQDCQLGQTLRKAGVNWEVVGIFEADGSGFESELWGDVEVFLTEFNRSVFQSITAKCASRGDLTVLNKSFDGDLRLDSLQVKVESQYYEEQSGDVTILIVTLGVFVTIIMSIGAMFGAMNTMYAAVSSRTREIGTLLALGFRPARIFFSFLIESLLLCFVGGLLGCLLALPFHGLATGTTNWKTFSEVAFEFQITPAILFIGVTFAVLMGLFGGALPAYRAARMKVVESFRKE